MNEHVKIPKELDALDAVRLLCNVIQQIQYFDREGVGKSLPCKTFGESMLCDAIEYLAYGDTRNARAWMNEYDHWVKTGEAPWIFDTEADPLSQTLQTLHRAKQKAEK